MDKKLYYQQIEKKNNILLIRAFVAILALGIIAFMSAEILAVSGVHKWPKTIAVCSAMAIIAMLPIFLRILKAPENIITYLIINLFIIIYGYMLLHILKVKIYGHLPFA